MNIWLIIAVYLVSGVVMSIIADKIIKGMLKSAVCKYNASEYDLLILCKSNWTAIALIAIVIIFWPIGLPNRIVVVAKKYNKIRKGI